MLWFLIFYLTGAYIGKYRVIYTGVKKLIFCLICLFIYYFSTSLFYKSINNEFNNIKGYYKRKIIDLLNRIITEDYDSPIKVMQSISMTLFFLQIKYNKYLSKIISFLGQFVFGIYLIHNNRIIGKNLLPKLFMSEPKNLSLNLTIFLVLMKTLIIFLICIFFDFLRHLIFTFLRIRKICLFLEKIVIKILN